MQLQDKPMLCRTPTWPNATTSYQDFRTGGGTAPRCNGCAAAAATGGGAVEDEVDGIGTIEGGAMSCQTLDTIGTPVGHTCGGNECSGHYATADAQFKVCKIGFFLEGY